MGRNVNRPGAVDTPPYRMSPRTASEPLHGQGFAIGKSLTASLTVLDITGAGIVDALGFTGGGLEFGSNAKVMVYLDIDGNRAMSASYTTTFGAALNNIVGMDGAAEGIPFNSSFKMVVKSVGQEPASFSLRGTVIYRIF